MNYEIHSQSPKSKLIGVGHFSLGADGSALAMDAGGKNIRAVLSRARVDWMQADGIMISGFEENGFGKNGLTKYRYQTWFLRYLSNV